MMETTLTVHSRWPRGMCRERTSTEKIAGWIDTFPPAEGHEQVGKLAALTECVTQRLSGETHGRMC